MVTSLVLNSTNVTCSRVSAADGVFKGTLKPMSFNQKSVLKSRRGFVHLRKYFRKQMR